MADDLAAIRERSAEAAKIPVAALTFVPVIGILAASAADVALLLAALEAARTALKRHMPYFESEGVKICAGCLRPSPCPDAEVIAEALAKGETP